MSVYLGTTLLAGTATETKYNANNLLDFKWSDHELNDQSWLNANTFSWQDGTVYSDAYSHLVADYSGGTSQTETIGSHTITFVEATDGHRITTDESTVADIYTESGVAWFYVLDTVNQRFKLPRTKYGFNGVRDTVGKYIEAGLPNIAGSFRAYLANVNDWNQTTGAFSSTATSYSSGVGGSNCKNMTFDIDASRSSSIYGNSTTVQPPATQMYLYFYVGQFSQSATEQTAGLNASLFNGKVDLDGNNATFPHIVESYVSGTDWYNLYSNGWCEQGGSVVTTSTNPCPVTLLKQYATTNYTVWTSHIDSAGNQSNYRCIKEKTTAGFSFWTWNVSGITTFWCACGYVS